MKSRWGEVLPAELRFNSSAQVKYVGIFLLEKIWRVFLFNQEVMSRVQSVVWVLLGCTAAFVAGVITAFISDEAIRNLIKYSYRFFTGNAIHFTGKDSHLFYPTYFYLTCGAVFAALYFLLKSTVWAARLRYASLFFFVFVSSVVFICFVDGNLKLAECTSCQDGRRAIPYSEIPFIMIITFSYGLSLFSVWIVRLIRRNLGVKPRQILNGKGGGVFQ